MTDVLRLKTDGRGRWGLTCFLGAVLALAVWALVLAGDASAGTERPAHCGEVITESIQLANDVGPCVGDGLIVGSDNIVVDLNGHRVFGVEGEAPEGQDPVGIRLEDRSFVKITNNPNDRATRANAVVSDFNAGVLIDGGEKNHVEHITADNNVSLGCRGQSGDGIVLFDSTKNQIVNNVVTRNGPFDGIGMIDEANENDVKQNTVHDNNRVNPFCRPGHNPGDPRTQEDDGIRLEPGVEKNLVSQNDVRRSGLDGVAVFVGATDNIVEQNQVVANGDFLEPVGQRRGSGVMVFGRATLNSVHHNFAEGNGADGITVECRLLRGTRHCADENFFLHNDIPSNRRDGIRVGNPHLVPIPAASGNADNRFQGNQLGPGNPEHDCHDDTTGTRDGGTGNFWRHNDPSSPVPDNRGGQICPGDPSADPAPDRSTTGAADTAAATQAESTGGRGDGVGLDSEEE